MQTPHKQALGSDWDLNRVRLAVRRQHKPQSLSTGLHLSLLDSKDASAHHLLSSTALITRYQNLSGNLIATEKMLVPPLL